MAQRFKSIYFADHPAASPPQRHVKLAFGPHDAGLYDATRGLSGQDLRDLLGATSYEGLVTSARQQDLTLNAYCLRVLRERLSISTDGGPPPAPAPGDADGRVIAALGEARREGHGPLHDWFPLLEGYAPQFVGAILDAYAPEARVVFDPFAGTGTTPIVAARRGLRGVYTEINPLLQFVIRVIGATLAGSRRKRLALADELEALASALPAALDAVPVAVDLPVAYAATFGDSAFFDPATMDRLLRCRTWLDQLQRRDAAVADLATVAALRELVPASLLTRAGDLRFRTPGELANHRPRFVGALGDRLVRMAEDLRGLGDAVLPMPPLLVAEDARALGRLPSLAIEAVVTSPPYLNGTNYFRNTKVELWFLRSLRSQGDLAAFRSRAVMAGINDVSARRELGPMAPPVATLVRHLEATAYDPRIPKMVRGYFQDMADIFDGLCGHVVPGALLAIDIGDSAYAGVHVPTDQLLVELLQARGFAFDRGLTLRRRMSRGGTVLHQALLILRAPSRPSIGRLTDERRTGRREMPAASVPDWQRRWDRFKSTLPHQREPFNKRNWGHPLHSLCSYQGKMKPSLAAHLVATFVPEGGALLDPFAGVATIPFEAALAGKAAYGFDISPAALIIGRAKLGTPRRADCEATLSGLAVALEQGSVRPEALREAETLGFNGAIVDYFHPDTLREVLLARQFFLTNPAQEAGAALVMACLLHILHGNRPYALSRRSHPITPFAPTGPTEYRGLLPRLREKVERSLATEHPPGFLPGTMLFQDATSWWPADLPALDAIITSPPFFDSTRFYAANWLRLWFAGWSASDFQSGRLTFVDELQKQDFGVYASIFRQSRERLRPGGVMVLHLGRSRKCDMAAVLSEVARPWFREADRFVESVEHCESHGIRDKGTVEEHQYLILQ